MTTALFSPVLSVKFQSQSGSFGTSRPIPPRSPFLSASRNGFRCSFSIPMIGSSFVSAPSGMGRIPSVSRIRAIFKEADEMFEDAQGPPPPPPPLTGIVIAASDSRDPPPGCFCLIVALVVLLRIRLQQFVEPPPIHRVTSNEKLWEKREEREKREEWEEWENFIKAARTKRPHKGEEGKKITRP